MGKCALSGRLAMSPKYRHMGHIELFMAILALSALSTARDNKK